MKTFTNCASFPYKIFDPPPIFLLRSAEVGEYNGDLMLASGETTRAISLTGLTVVPEITASGTFESFKESVSSFSDAQCALAWNVRFVRILVGPEKVCSH